MSKLKRFSFLGVAFLTMLLLAAGCAPTAEPTAPAEAPEVIA